MWYVFCWFESALQFVVLYFIYLMSFFFFLGTRNIQIYHLEESDERPSGLEETTADRNPDARSNSGTKAQDYSEDRLGQQVSSVRATATQIIGPCAKFLNVGRIPLWNIRDTHAAV